jgi:hypothetical protein
MPTSPGPVYTASADQIDSQAVQPNQTVFTAWHPGDPVVAIAVIHGGGALLSCVGFGWYEWRAMGLRKGEWVQGQVGKEVLMEVGEGC